MRIMGLDIRLARRVDDARKEEPLRARVQRLEIALAELVEHHNALAGAHGKLRNQFHGAKGGRPASQSPQLPLDAVPHGDKAALRRVMGIVPGSRFNHQE